MQSYTKKKSKGGKWGRRQKGEKTGECTVTDATLWIGLNLKSCFDSNFIIDNNNYNNNYFRGEGGRAPPSGETTACTFLLLTNPLMNWWWNPCSVLSMWAFTKTGVCFWAATHEFELLELTFDRGGTRPKDSKTSLVFGPYVALKCWPDVGHGPVPDQSTPPPPPPPFPSPHVSSLSFTLDDLFLTSHVWQLLTFSGSVPRSAPTSLHSPSPPLPPPLLPSSPSIFHPASLHLYQKFSDNRWITDFLAQIASHRTKQQLRRRAVSSSLMWFSETTSAVNVCLFTSFLTMTKFKKKTTPLQARG